MFAFSLLAILFWLLTAHGNRHSQLTEYLTVNFHKTNSVKNECEAKYVDWNGTVLQYIAKNLQQIFVSCLLKTEKETFILVNKIDSIGNAVNTANS